MKMKTFFLVSIASLAGTMLLNSCQGAIDDDITDLFETYTATPSATVIPSSGGFYGSGNGRNQSEEIIRKLIGKWICKKYVFVDEVSESYNDNERYVQFDADFTAVVHPYNLFEAEKGECTWQLDGYSKIIFNNDEENTYSIMQLTSSTLILGWLEDGKVIEITTFKKAN